MLSIRTQCIALTLLLHIHAELLRPALLTQLLRRGSGIDGLERQAFDKLEGQVRQARLGKRQQVAMNSTSLPSTITAIVSSTALPISSQTQSPQASSSQQTVALSNTGTSAHISAIVTSSILSLDSSSVRLTESGTSVPSTLSVPLRTSSDVPSSLQQTVSAQPASTVASGPSSSRSSTTSETFDTIFLTDITSSTEDVMTVTIDAGESATQAMTLLQVFSSSPSNVRASPTTSTVLVVVPGASGPRTLTSQVVLWVATRTPAATGPALQSHGSALSSFDAWLPISAVLLCFLASIALF